MASEIRQMTYQIGAAGLSNPAERQVALELSTFSLNRSGGVTDCTHCEQRVAVHVRLADHRLDAGRGARLSAPSLPAHGDDRQAPLIAAHPITGEHDRKARNLDQQLSIG